MDSKNTAHTHNSPSAEGNTPGKGETTRRGKRGRRQFLTGVGGALAAGVASGAVLTERVEAAPVVSDESIRGVAGLERAEGAYRTRVMAALNQRSQPIVQHLTNGDEDRYPTRIGNFSKGLPHNSLGEVDPVAYNQLVKSMKSGDPADFDQIPMGGTAQLKNPQAGLTYQLAGMDPAGCEMAAPPSFSSPEMAAEIAENYWMALTRDINFLDYETSPMANVAAQDLTRFSDFRGPRYIAPALRAPIIRVSDENGEEVEIDPSNQFAWQTNPNAGTSPVRRKAEFAVTPAVLFRGLTPGDLVGPLVSQFMWLDIPYGAQTIVQRNRVPIAGDNYLTSYDDWLFAQNSRGHRNLPNRYDSIRRYIRNGRDLGEWAHIDVLFQGYFSAVLILLGMNAPVDSGNPYADSKNQCAFGTFGNPHSQSMVCAVASLALQSVWYQKWFVHRRLRPEAFAGRIHNHVTRKASYPLSSEILNSAVLPEVQRQNGTYLLPQAFAEGCPSHPAYGAGHATVAGACVTILKAWFDESWEIPSPVIPSADGTTLLPWRGAPLTVGGELNKVASNVALGRNMGGVHWRSDATQSLRLGEQVAINYLKDMKNCFNERFGGFSLTKFDGQTIRI
ncbi:MAG: vanadium-dependent haloperoxidase [Acidobacteriota bacterium]